MDRIVDTLAYGDKIPGPVIRATVGDEVVVTVTNRLGQPTSVHWHGIALRNDMDGVEPATPNIPAGDDFTYRFSVPNPGTYWAHPHTGLDADKGLYLPFIVDDPTEAGRYDAEWIVVLDDWTDGVGKSPQQLYDALKDPNKPRMQEPAPTTTTSPSGVRDHVRDDDSDPGANDDRHHHDQTTTTGTSTSASPSSTSGMPRHAGRRGRQ